jgi:hypothetical protein
VDHCEPLASARVASQRRHVRKNMQDRPSSPQDSPGQRFCLFGGYTRPVTATAPCPASGNRRTGAELPALSRAQQSGRGTVDVRSLQDGDDVGMIDADEFERLRAQVCASGPASSGDNLLGMEIDACAYLGDPEDDPGLWHEMSVNRSEGSEWLITGRASGKAEDAAAIASTLSRIWDEQLRYNYQSAHTVVSTPDSITLRAVTQIDPGGIWVTAAVQVALS